MNKKQKRGYMTLAEHDAWLKETGQWDDYVARKKERDEAHQRLVEEFRRAEAPLVEALREAGYELKSVWDLVNTKTPYPKALPILLEHLTRPYPDAVREGIARALAVPEAKFAWSTLTKLFREEQEKRVKDGLACAIAATADDEVIGEVIKFLRDPAQTSKVLLLSALERSSDPRARTTLMELGTDPVLGRESRASLQRLKKTKRKL